MPRFHVTVTSRVRALAFEREVQSQNVVHAAACGLSLVGGGSVDLIEVTALQPRSGRSASTIFRQCSQGIYGFVFLDRKEGSNGKRS